MILNMEDPTDVVKVCPTFSLKLTTTELIHLRDLFGIVLPPDGVKTVSEALASIENRLITESKLWQKIATLCKEAKLPIDDEAPNFVAAPAGPPPMGVFQLNAEFTKSESSGALEKLFMQVDQAEIKKDEGDKDGS
jgi:hypothetical protein